MFLSCGLVSKTSCCWFDQGSSYLRMQTTLLPGLCLPGLELCLKDRRLYRGALWFEDHCSPFLLLTCHTPFYHLPFSLTHKGWGRWEGRGLFLLKNKIICCQPHLPIFGLLLMGLLRIIVFQVFNPQVTKVNIHLHSLYYFLYLWVIHSAGAGWWSYLNLDLPVGLPQSCWGGLLGVVKSPVVVWLYLGRCIKLLIADTL